MQNRIKFRKLGRKSAHRTSMFRNMVTSLVQHERIRTTLPKAKELRHFADRVVTWAKRGEGVDGGPRSAADHIQRRLELTAHCLL